MSIGFIGHGTVVRYAATPDSAGVGTVDTIIGQCRTLNGPNQSTEEVDISNFDSVPASPGVPFREFIPGFRDSGDMTLEAVYEFQTWDTIVKASDLGLTSWDFELPDLGPGGTPTGMLLTLIGFVNSGPTLTDQYDDVITVQFGVRITGAVGTAAPV